MILFETCMLDWGLNSCLKACDYMLPQNSWQICIFHSLGTSIKLVFCTMRLSNQLLAMPRFSENLFCRLIEECWSENPADRPTFRGIIDRLTYIQNQIANKMRWKVYHLLIIQLIQMTYPNHTDSFLQKLAITHFSSMIKLIAYCC